MKVEILNPFGYCTGVNRAIKLVFDLKKKYKEKKIYIIGNLIHNKELTNLLNKKGFFTIKDKKEVENNSIVVFSAHGHIKKEEKYYIDKKCIVYDATCPIIKNTISKVNKYLNDNRQIIFIGKKNHEETKAIMNLDKNNIFFCEIKDSFNKPSIEIDSPIIINQSSLMINELINKQAEIKEIYPNVQIENTICPSILLRQSNLLKYSNDVDLIIIIGDLSSSNANSLYEIADKKFINATKLFINKLNEAKKLNLSKFKNALIVSSTSASNKTVQSIYNFLLNN